MIDYSFIKRIARMYRNQHPDHSIASAVARAYEAYDFYREAEVEVMDEQYRRSWEINIWNGWN